MFVGFTYPLLAIVSNLHLLDDTSTACIFSLMSSGVAMGCPRLILSAIAIERFIAIVYPFIYERYVSNYKMIMVSIVLWLYTGTIPNLLWAFNKWYDGVYCIAEILFFVICRFSLHGVSHYVSGSVL